MKEREFTAVYEQDREWIFASVEELPGAFGQGRSIDEARTDLEAAIVLMLEANREIVAADESRGIHHRESVLVQVP